jgi:hypothetical protein
LRLARGHRAPSRSSSTDIIQRQNSEYRHAGTWRD